MEKSPQCYLLFSPLSAKRLTIITYVIHFIEAISVWFLGYTMHHIFTFQFFLSDTINFLTVLTFMFHPETNKQLLQPCIAFSLHYVGVIWAVLISATSLYRVPKMKDGSAWITIICSSLLQLYLE